MKIELARKENKSIQPTSVGFNCIGRSSKSSPFSAAPLLPIAISSVLLAFPPALLLLAVDGDVILWLEAAGPWWLVSVPSADARLISFWFLTKFKKTCKVWGIHCEHKRAPTLRIKVISLTNWLWQNSAQLSHRNAPNWPKFTFKVNVPLMVWSHWPTPRLIKTGCLQLCGGVHTAQRH